MCKKLPITLLIQAKNPYVLLSFSIPQNSVNKEIYFVQIHKNSK